MATYRTHTCNELRNTNTDEVVKLSGWIHNKRDHGGVLFIDLRDTYGLTQLVVYPDKSFQNELSHLPKETVISIDGKVAQREEGAVNSKRDTGEIEVDVSGFKILSECKELPFTVHLDDETPEDLRLKYRYLDLRRNRMHNNVKLRSEIITFIRKCMYEKSFYEFQTPILTSSSPEGARDFLVPSRVHPGQFYALPQAPQQFKQLFMVSGFDKYFQIAPCFRDEDARADRSPGEFYQLDIEMSFATQDEIFAVTEDVLNKVFSKFSNKETDQIPFRRIPYKEAMLKYGTDKPDLRIKTEIKDVSDIFRESDFKVFSKNVLKGGCVRSIAAKNVSKKPRSFFDNIVKFAQDNGSKGLAYVVLSEEGPKGPIVKFLSEEELQLIIERNGCETGDAIFFVSDKISKTFYRIVSRLRVKLAQELEEIEEAFRFCWIVDYPMFELNEESGKIEFSHNPFSMPQGEMEALKNSEPLDILAYQYDIVCNGIELSSGAIRNHRPDIMYEAFRIAGYDKSVVEEKFPALINAFHYGAPPHGGIAPGIDRIIMLIAEEENLRDVTAFPMNQRAQDLMMNAPSDVTPQQVSDLGLKVVNF